MNLSRVLRVSISSESSESQSVHYGWPAWRLAQRAAARACSRKTLRALAPGAGGVVEAEGGRRRGGGNLNEEREEGGMVRMDALD
jgi:hypothetical protein